MTTDLSTPDRQVLDVAGAALLLGATHKAVRQRIARRLLPYRKLGSRILFLRTELEEFLAALPGCTLSEAQQNLEVRRTHGLD